MAIRIYSDKTQRFYNSVTEAQEAEFQAKEQENREKILAERKAAELKAKKEKEAAERKEAAAVVEAARKNLVEAQKVYKKAIEDFCGKYGTYHYSSDGKDFPTLFDLFNTVLF